MAAEPQIILVGYGVTDTLQLSIESQRVLNRAGKVYALHLPPNLKRHLASMRVSSVDLGPILNDGRSPAEAYADVVGFLLRRAAEEKELVVLTPGSPHMFNMITRFLARQAKTNGIRVSAYPAISQLDAIICYLGLDVTTYGLQIFDARRLTAAGHSLNPRVPLLVMHVAGLALPGGEHDPAAYEPLTGILASFYPPDQPATLVHVGLGDRGSKVTVRLQDFAIAVPRVKTGSALFIERIRAPAAAARPKVAGKAV